MNRNSKRGLIIAIYIGIVLGIIGLIAVSREPVMSCTDGIHNQNEVNIDCGGVCPACVVEINAKDLIVEDVDVLYGGTGKYDVLATVRNPNPLYGASRVVYTITLFDAGEKEIARVTDTGFILPTQERYFAAANILSDVAPARAHMQIDDIVWVSFTGFEDPDFTVQNFAYGPVKNGRSYASVTGLVRNNSAFDFVRVTGVAVIRDERGMPIALNKTEWGSFDAREARDFRLTWPEKFPGVIADAEMAVYADVFDSHNFSRKYLPEGQFEQR